MSGKIRTIKKKVSFRLLKDIVIKAGTIFTTSPRQVKYNEEHAWHDFGLTKNTAGSIAYEVGNDESDTIFERIEE
jgi:hypothetical protein